VSNVLNEEKKQQVIALGRLGWSLRRIQRNTGVRRETAAGYLKAAGIAFRPPGGWGREPPAKPAFSLIADAVDLIADHALLIGAIRIQSGETMPAAVVIDTLNRSLHGLTKHPAPCNAGRSPAR